MEEKKEIDSKEVAVIEDIKRPQEVALFGQKAAGVLKDIVKQAKLIKNINGNEYMMFEGWQTVGKFFKTNAGVEWTKQVLNQSGDLQGFEARAYVQDEKGRIISTAESYCGKDETTWNNRPIFAMRSMAQTRACAKALRQVYSWVVVLAGYKPTPVEEMDGIEPNKPKSEIQIPKDPTEMKCQKCGQTITEKVYKFSMEKYNIPLCFNHQKELKDNPQENSIEEVVDVETVVGSEK